MALPVSLQAPSIHPSLDSTINKLLSASIAPKTRSSYHKSLIKFSSFCLDEFKLSPFTSGSHQIVSYIAFLHQAGYSSSSIRCQLSAISFFYKINDIHDYTQSFLVKKVIQGSSKSSIKSLPRLPVTVDILTTLLSALPKIGLVGYKLLMFRSMFTLAFYAFLRIGEYTVQSQSVVSPHVLSIDNVHIIKCKKRWSELRVTFSSFKHSKMHHPVTLCIKSKSSVTCPVMFMSRYLSCRPKKMGPLFILQDCIPVSTRYFSQVFRSCIEYLSLDPKSYTPHSFRIGAATEAASSGVSDAALCAMGRWSSDAYKKYIRIQSLPL